MKFPRLNCSRYLIERSELHSAEPMLQMALGICEDKADELKELLCTTLFGMAKFGSWTNMPLQEVHEYSKRCYDLCKELDDGTVNSVERTASAESNLGMTCMLIGEYEEAIHHCEVSEELDKTNPETLAGKGWPHFARIYRAWALAALGRYLEANDLLLGTIDWRSKTYGPEDTQSVKYIKVTYRD